MWNVAIRGARAHCLHIQHEEDSAADTNSYRVTLQQGYTAPLFVQMQQPCIFTLWQSGAQLLLSCRSSLRSVDSTTPAAGNPASPLRDNISHSRADIFASNVDYSCASYLAHRGLVWGPSVSVQQSNDEKSVMRNAQLNLFAAEK